MGGLTQRLTLAGLAIGLSGGLCAQVKVPVIMEVREPGGAPIAKASVIVSSKGGTPVQRAVTETSGRATIKLASGEYTVRVEEHEHVLASKLLTVTGIMRDPVVLTVATSCPPSCAVVQRAVNPVVTEISPLHGLLQTDEPSAHAPSKSASLLVIEAGPGERGVFTASSLGEYPQTKVTVFDRHAKKNVTYAGVPLMDLLAHLGVPHGKNLMGKPLQDYIVATGSDGYKTVLSLGEVDPDFHPGTVLVADELDGKPLDAKTGPFRLVVSEDRNATRSVWGLVKIELKKAE